MIVLLHPSIEEAAAWIEVVREYRQGTGSAYRYAKVMAKLLNNNTVCAYCSDKAETFDHIVPRSAGGTDDNTNLTPVCKSCNESKGAQQLEEWIVWNKPRNSKIITVARTPKIITLWSAYDYAEYLAEQNVEVGSIWFKREVDYAAVWLEEYLILRPKRLPFVLQAAHHNHVNLHALVHAKMALGIVVVVPKNGNRKQAMWALPS